MTGTTEHLCPEEGAVISKEEFARIAGLRQAQVQELIDYGLLAADKLDLGQAVAVREAARLATDFDLDTFSTGLLAGYIKKIHELEADLRRVSAEHPVRSIVTEVSFTSVEFRRESME